MVDRSYADFRGFTFLGGWVNSPSWVPQVWADGIM
jgi:hypothetical protein